MKQSNGIISTPPENAWDTPPADEDEEAGAEVEWRTVQLSAAQHGTRLDKALAEVLPEFSRSYLQQLMEAGRVTLNAQAAHKTALKVKAGDTVVVELRPTAQSQAFKPQAMDLTVVYEDAHMLVIDKPAGLVVHPAPGNWSGTLLNGLLARNPDAALVPRAGIVHRLDKDTSGLMVVARTRAAMDALVLAIAERRVSRQYLALAHGAWAGHGRVSVEAPIGRDPRNRLRMAAVDLLKTAGKTAKTDFHLQSSGADACLVRCVLHTGRTHQIRVHMATLGHPLVGDVLYGGRVVPGMARQSLHACYLALHHPIHGALLQFDSVPAPDMAALLQAWGLRYNPQPAPQGA